MLRSRESAPVGVRALGRYVPAREIGNDQMAEWTSTTPEWIARRTGVGSRRYADAGTPTSTLGVRAVEDMLAHRPGALGHVGHLVCATSTPDQPQPATAGAIQHTLGLAQLSTFDLNAVCSGFVVAVLAGASMAAYTGQDALVVAADKYSSIVDRHDRRTAPLFGDGAGAAVLGAVPEGYGIHAHRALTDGEHRALVTVAAGGTRRAADERAREQGLHLFAMSGRAVRDWVVGRLPPLILDTVADAGLTCRDIDRFVIHQANPLMIADLAACLDIDPARVPVTADRYGNSGGASVAVTLAESDRAAPIERGERVVLGAVGGGLNAIALVMTWY